MALYRCLAKSGGGGMTETVLWTNPAPSANFAAQSMNLSQDMTNYDFICIEWKISTNVDTKYKVYWPVSDFVDFSQTTGHGQAAICTYANAREYRGFRYISNTEIGATAETASQNQRCIPLYVYGCKL